MHEVRARSCGKWIILFDGVKDARRIISNHVRGLYHQVKTDRGHLMRKRSKPGYRLGDKMRQPLHHGDFAIMALWRNHDGAQAKQCF